jgi:hypothetical protein
MKASVRELMHLRWSSLIAFAGIATAAVWMLAPACPARAEVNWLCRPGHKIVRVDDNATLNDPCETDETATVRRRHGAATVEHRSPAQHPPIDCFYVYPTIEYVAEDTGPGGIGNSGTGIHYPQVDIAKEQASRFSGACRVYAPIYRQLTITTIQDALNDPSIVPAGALQKAYSDVLEAWQTYLADYNHGRGVVLIGHDQGAFMLIRLIQEQIDTHPAIRDQLVSAILPGSNVAVPKGTDVGGTFQHVPACHSSSQLGCVLSYDSFKEAPPADGFLGRLGGVLDTIFPGSGGNSATEQELCVNPAALVGDDRVLHPYFRTSPVGGAWGYFQDPPPKAHTPWVKFPKLYKSQCERAHGASWLQISRATRKPDRRPRVHELLGPGYGLHIYDMNLPFGEIVRLVKSEAMAYVKRTPH